MDRKIKKATTKKKKERIGALKVNIKRTQGKSEHTSYRLYKVQIKGKKGWKQPTFHDSGSGLDVVGKEKMERDGAILIPKVLEGLEVLDFNGNQVEIIGYTTYLVAPLGSNSYKSKKFLSVQPSVMMSSLLVWRP